MSMCINNKWFGFSSQGTNPALEDRSCGLGISNFNGLFNFIVIF